MWYAKTAKIKYIVTQIMGLLSLCQETRWYCEAFRNFEVANRRQNTEHSYTFHGRDVYAYTGAKLASGHISFEEVGPELSVDSDCGTSSRRDNH